MEINSAVVFGDLSVKQAFDELKSGPYQDQQLHEWLERAKKDLQQNAFCGIQIAKRLIPKEYHAKFGHLDNLWKYNLPDAWRLMYTVKQDQIVVLSIVLAWMKHKEYERKFKY